MKLLSGYSARIKKAFYENKRASLLLSFVDQVTVSAGNFLVIVIGAHFLPIDEQGKLIYSYAVYIGFVLLNTSLFFAMSPIVKAELADFSCYHLILKRCQIISGVITSIGATGALYYFSNMLGWSPSGTELLFLFLFLLLQQYSDFRRRGGYVFEKISIPAQNSIIVFTCRISLLVLFKPENVSEFLAIMAAAALPGAILMLFKTARYVGGVCAATEIYEITMYHLTLSKWHIMRMPLLWCGLQLPIILTGVLYSAEAAAILGSLRAITSFTSIFFELIETITLKWFIARLSDEGADSLKLASRKILLFSGAIWLLGLAIIHEWAVLFVALILGDNYINYAYILTIIWIGSGVDFFGRVVGLFSRVIKKDFVGFFGALGGGIALIMCTPVIASHGVVGGAYSLIIVQAASIITILIVYAISSNNNKDG